MEDNLIFVIAPPRSGSTLLQRLIGSHSEVMTHPEPHLITPLNYLGYYDKVDKAPYDHINAAEALHTFVGNLPEQEKDYLAALRAYCDTMYGRMLKPTGKKYFLDKTPAYALVLSFLSKLYPSAHYVVLTRHPLGIFSSYAKSFFNDDWHAAHSFNPIVERYVPAITRFLKDPPRRVHHVHYEALVETPEAHLQALFQFLGLAHEPDAVNYGKHFKSEKKGMGDPFGVEKHQRPVTDSKDAWIGQVSAEPARRELAKQMMLALDDRDLEPWGLNKAATLSALSEKSKSASLSPKAPFSWYTLKRRVLLALKKNIHQRAHGRVLKKVRYYCDVLLRDA
jgi:hypothetical protein